ncbi:hypothetical protein ACFLRZ_04925 [Bacteroidota bacterium]
MKKNFLIIATILFIIVSCKNKTTEQNDISNSDSTATQSLIPSLPEGKDSSYIKDTIDFGYPIESDIKLSLDEILTKHFLAIGQDKINKVQTKIITGKTLAGGKSVKFKNIFKRPNKSYAEVDYGEHVFYQGYDGEKGWRLYTLESEVPLYVYGEQLQAIKDQSKFDNPLSEYKEKGLKLELYGMSEIEGKSVYRIKMVNKGINILYFFIDAQDFKLVKALTRITYTNQESDYETLFSNYKMVDEILMAFQIEEIVNNQYYSRTIIENVEFDAAVDDDIFKMPESEVDQEVP